MKTKQLQKSKLSKKEKKELKMQEEDVPTCYSSSIQSIEKDLRHGFWGNPNSGYVYNDNQ
jgi:hypothetical protein